MRPGWFFVSVLVVCCFLQAGCASSINTVYKARSLGEEQICADIIVNGVSTTITKVYSPNEDGTYKADDIIVKDSASMEMLKTAYNLTPWGLMTRAFDATSTGVYEVPAGNVVILVFSRRLIPLIREKPGPELFIPLGWYSLISDNLEADGRYELDTAEKLGGPPVFSPESKQHRYLGGAEARKLMAIEALPQ